MTAEARALDALASWYNSLPVQKHGLPPRGTIAAALVVLEKLKSDYVLDLASHRAPGGAQIRGASGAAVQRILLRFGETRRFVKEGGRTNRGGPGNIEGMLNALRSAALDDLDPSQRTEVIDVLQAYMVGKVLEYHNRQRLKIVYDPAQSTWQSINDLLGEAERTGKAGPVAQYLVGAKLQLRFSNMDVGNESYSTADDQLQRPGDFCVGDTAIHVTVAPMPGVYEKCKRNLEVGFRVYLLVPDRLLIGTRQNAASVASGRVSVESIESFVSQNIEELSQFSKDRLSNGFRNLLETYNRRVDAVELDKSLLVEIPSNLLHRET